MDINMTPVVTGNLYTRPVIVHDFVTDETIKVFKCCNTSSVVERLLGVHPDNAQTDRRPLSKSDIIEQLI
jgi:hypothetical protein